MFLEKFIYKPNWLCKNFYSLPSFHTFSS